jgi:hypothetical protein
MDWFHLPAPPAEAPPERSEHEERMERLQGVLAELDPRMLTLGWRHRDAADRMRREFSIAQPGWSDPDAMLHVDVSQVDGYFVEPRVARVDHLKEDLESSTPQALLRDLYRPEGEWQIQYAPPWEGALGDYGDPLRVVREALRTRIGGVRLEFTPAAQTITAAAAERRARVDFPWHQQGKRKDDWTPLVRGKR